MDPIGHHLLLRLFDDRVIARTLDARRVFVSQVHRLPREARVLGMGVADNHLQVLLACDRRTAGKAAHALEVGLSRRLKLKARFEAARIKPVVHPRHLYAAFFYILAQDLRHGGEIDPTRESTCLQDVLGLRVGGEHIRKNVEALLPRVAYEDLQAMVRFEWGTRETDIRAVLVIGSTARVPLRGAIALANDMEPRFGPEVLGRSVRTAQRLRRRQPDKTIADAMRLRWFWPRAERPLVEHFEYRLRKAKRLRSDLIDTEVERLDAIEAADRADRALAKSDGAFIPSDDEARAVAPGGSGARFYEDDDMSDIERDLDPYLGADDVLRGLVKVELDKTDLLEPTAKGSMPA